MTTEIFILQDKYNLQIERLIQEAWESAYRRCDMLGYKLLDVALLHPPTKLENNGLEWKVKMLYE